MWPALSVASPPGGGEGDVRVVHSDESVLILEYRPRYEPLRTIPGPAETYTEIPFAGAEHAAAPDRPGFPDVPLRRVAVGFPTPEGNRVTVLKAEYEELRNLLPPPAPRLREMEGMLVADSYEADPAAYNAGTLLPPEPAELGSPRRVRSMYVGSVLFHPVQYNPSLRTARKHTRIVVQVQFGPPAGRREQSTDGALIGEGLINGDAAREWTFPPPRPLRRLTQPSVLSTGIWYRLAVREEGIYRLDPAYFQSIGIDPGQVDPRTIRIHGNGGRELPENPAESRPQDLVENPLYVEGESDGQFNAGDFVLFYGEGPGGWTYTPSNRTYSHDIHRYAAETWYWLTWGGAQGLRMQARPSLADPPSVVPGWFDERMWIEEEQVNLLSSGKDWYGQTLSQGGSFTHYLPLVAVVPGLPVRYRAGLVARSTSWSTFLLREGSDSIGTVYVAPILPNNADYQYAQAAVGDVRAVPAAAASAGRFTFVYRSSSASGTGWIDWAEITYPRRFEAAGNRLSFRAPDTSGIVEYRLEGFPSQPVILDVTNPVSARRVTGVAGAYYVRLEESSGLRSEYAAASAGGFRIPVRAERIPNQNLRGITEGADFIIVTSREFRNAADRLAAHREQPAHGGLRTLVVEADTIYNEFGGGMPDPTAIRDFLKHAYESWTPRPEYVLLFGGASYDYRGYSGVKSSYVPTWQSIDSRNEINSYSSDDFFVRFESSTAPFLVGGRISSRTAAEAETVVDKVIRYDTQSARDGWGARMLFVGDDSWTPEREDGTQHSADADRLATVFTPDEIEKRKIYIAEYPTVNSAQGRRKPGAYDALVEEINRGVLAVNFAGHGNPTVWAHESIFNVQTSIPLLVNADRLSVFFAATCNFSQFDDLKRYTGSELLMNKPDGGAVAVVSATRKVFAGANAYLHQNIFARLFLRDTYGRLAVGRPARAMFLQKAALNNPNDQKFHWMGDPTLRLRYPEGFASIDSINGEPLDSVGGVPRTEPVQLRALSRVTLRGSLRDQANQVDVSRSGTVILSVYDATREVLISPFIPPRCCDSQGNIIPGLDWSYTATGGTIYRGQGTVTQGRFAAVFVVPKDILYADPSTRGRVTAYFTGTGGEALAYTGRVSVGGTDSTAAPDGEGPQVAVFLDSRTFRSGDPVRPDPVLLADLRDSSGINTSGSGIGHRIEAWVDNSSESVDLTESYTSRLDEFREGTVEKPLGGLPPGRHHVRVRAWDTWNNAGTAEVFFEVTPDDALAVSEVMNYPNPFAETTEFTFRQNQLTPLRVTVRVFTLAGRLVQSIEAGSTGEPFVRIPWDGRDRDGDRIANGVYLYKLVVRTEDGRFASESLGKMTVLR
ncbi:MAG: type IX secretion system sortase PorU [Bacteroidota bacterium]